MLENYTQQPEHTQWQRPDGVASRAETETVVMYPEHVPTKFENNPDAFVLKHKLELDADNTIVIVGDSLAYFGGTLSDTEMENLKVPVPDYFSPDSRNLGTVKAIKEDGRTIAFATNTEKAKKYIMQNRVIVETSQV